MASAGSPRPQLAATWRILKYSMLAASLWVQDQPCPWATKFKKPYEFLRLVSPELPANASMKTMMQFRLT
eukprot:4843376-Amphidinium_carterae.1